MMRKMITVNSCLKCPWVGTDSEDEMERPYCSIDDECRYVKVEIPEWCPLPNAPEQESGE